MSLAPVPIVTGDIAAELDRYARHLRAQNVSPRTVGAYTEAVRQLAAYLAAQGMPTDVATIRREHVEAFISDLLGRKHADGRTWKPATAHNRYRGCRSFFGWLVAEDVIARSPMEKMKPPRVPEQPVPVLRETELRALLATCEKGLTFDQRRDYALLRVFIGTGARLAEVAGLRHTPGDDGTNDVDLDQGVIRVLGKGRRERVVGLGAKELRALDRYLRVRSKHPRADEPWLWIGKKGRFGESGIGHMVADRGREAGLPGRVGPHDLRHSSVHHNLGSGMSDTDAMRIYGWRSRDMLSRYAASTGSERAIAAQKKIGFGDRL